MKLNVCHPNFTCSYDFCLLLTKTFAQKAQVYKMCHKIECLPFKLTFLNSVGYFENSFRFTVLRSIAPSWLEIPDYAKSSNSILSVFNHLGYFPLWTIFFLLTKLSNCFFTRIKRRINKVGYPQELIKMKISRQNKDFTTN